MRGFVILFAAAAITAAAQPVFAGQKIRLAQTSTVTNCLMMCNAQAANCQTACLVPGTAPTSAATTTSNAAASTACLLACNSVQLTCHTNCARLSPSP